MEKHLKNPCFQSLVLQRKDFFSLPVYFSKVKKYRFKISKWFFNIWICICFYLFQIATYVMYVLYMYTYIFFKLDLLCYIYYPILLEEWYSCLSAWNMPLFMWYFTYSDPGLPSAFLLWGVHFTMHKKYSSISVVRAIIFQCLLESECELCSFEQSFRLDLPLCESSHLFLRYFSFSFGEGAGKRGRKLQ